MNPQQIKTSWYPDKPIEEMSKMEIKSELYYNFSNMMIPIGKIYERANKRKTELKEAIDKYV